MCYIYMSFLWNPPEKVVPAWKVVQMMDLAMVITTAAIIYLATWSLYSHDKMSGVVSSILAAMAAIILVVEITAYAVIFLPVLPWEVSAAVFTAATTLFITCALARVNGRSKLLRGKSR